MTTPSASIQALRSLGYTNAEGEFLYLVAIHSGYFTHSQYLSFSQIKPGYVSHEFTAKLIRQKHASFHAYRSGGRVYHLFSRKVYNAIGRDNLRTRRRHQLDYIKTRLVTLDFVLEHPDYPYLETESEKVPFFAEVLKVPADVLPRKLYCSSKSDEARARYFVDRYPIYADSLSSPTVVTFTYADPGSVTLQPFRTHLAAYAGLLRALSRFEFEYLAPTVRLAQAAESEFHDMVFGHTGAASTEQLLRYFRLRLAWKSERRVASSDVLFLKARFHGNEFELLYKRWRQRPLNTVELASQLGADVAVRGVFRSRVCGASLSVFGEERTPSTESGRGGACTGVSAQVSGEVSGA
jgi:hypothetical protein